MRWNNFKRRVLKQKLDHYTFEATILATDDDLLKILYEQKEYVISITPHELVKFTPYIGSECLIEVTKRCHIKNKIKKANSFTITDIGTSMEYKAPSLKGLEVASSKLFSQNQFLWKTFPKDGEEFIMVGFDDSDDFAFEWSKHLINRKIVPCIGTGCEHCMDSFPVKTYSMFVITPKHGLSIMHMSENNVRSIFKTMRDGNIESPYPDPKTNTAIAFICEQHGKFINMKYSNVDFTDDIKKETAKSRSVERLRKNVLNFNK